MPLVSHIQASYSSATALDPAQSGADFLWLVLQHVLPKGFLRAHNFGFLHPNCRRLIALLQVVLKFAPRLSTT